MIPDYWTYDPARGAILGKRGQPIGSLDDRGYVQICTAERKTYRVHRVAFYLMLGRWPTEIDHINGDKSDNRWCNLREVSHSTNMHNKVDGKNTSGVKGVSFHTARSRWVAQIVVHKKHHFLGYFTDWFEAVCARKSAENRFNTVIPEVDYAKGA